MTDRRSLVSVTTFAAAALAFMTLGCAAVEAEPLNGQQLAFDRSKGNCLACHTMTGSDVPSNVGPELSNSGTRLKPGWIAAWLSKPQAYKPGTLQPDYNLSSADARALTAYLSGLGRGNAAAARKGHRP